MKPYSILQFVSFSVLATPVSALASHIQGQVIDANQQAVPYAEIEIIDTKQIIQANATGEFSFENIKPGHYELHLSANTYSHKNVHLDVPANGVDNFIIQLNPSSIEVIDVTASPFHGSQIESAQPVSVLSGEQLKSRQAATLGDTLKNEVGVHSSFYGSVASSPIIRGLDGPRVLVTQNGLDVGDVSRVGPDHAVATSAASAEQIEILRGPATLFFGSGAIGGVVNVVDNRIPRDAETEGQWNLQYDTVNQQKLASVSVKSGIDNFAYYLDGFISDSDSYAIPDYTPPHSDEDESDVDHEDEHDDETIKKVENSQAKATGFTLGSSYLFNNEFADGFVGVSYGYLSREYGIPGHDHGHEAEADEHDEEHEDSHADGVIADMHQHRVQLLGEWNLNDSFISQINVRAGYSDYQHQEIEDGAVATTFTSEGSEFKTEFLHSSIDDWRGGINLHFKQAKQAAIGEEAFTPASTTNEFALAWMEEKHFGNWLVQLGARAEHIEIKADAQTHAEIDLHSLNDAIDHDEHAEEHEHDEESLENDIGYNQLDFNPLSFSAGLVWDFTPGYNVAISYSLSERAPSAAELYSFGAHLAANTYEVGAIYQLHEEDGEQHFEFNSGEIKLERSNNLDLSLRKFEGDFGFLVNLFYNQVDNYYHEAHTGFTTPMHSEEESAAEAEAHEHDEGMLPVYIFTTADAELYGYEAEVFWRVNNAFNVKLQSDLVRARLTDSKQNLARTPPMRLAASANYQANDYSLNMSVSHYFEQTHIDEYESKTDGYTMLDVNANYYLDGFGQDLVVFLKAQNLTNELGLVHSSFLKEKAPLPGRNFALGIRGYF